MERMRRSKIAIRQARILRPGLQIERLSRILSKISKAISMNPDASVAPVPVACAPICSMESMSVPPIYGPFLSRKRKNPKNMMNRMKCAKKR